MKTKTIIKKTFNVMIPVVLIILVGAASLGFSNIHEKTGINHDNLTKKNHMTRQNHPPVFSSLTI